VRHIAINLAACAALFAAAVAAGDLSAEAVNDPKQAAWPDEQESREKIPLGKWLPTVIPALKTQAQPETAAPESEPVAAEPAAPPPKKRRARRAPEPPPEPEPKLTPEEQEAEDLWWKETGDPAVAAFSRCLSEHVIDETSRGSQASYPEFVTSAMNGRCSREFAIMAQLVLDRHGEDNFARIARKLIATRFVPAVKRVVEGGPVEDLPPEDQKPVLQAELRQSKEAMLACMTAEADRQAASSDAPVENIADGVIAACRTTADDFFAKLEKLNPGTFGSAASEVSAAILDTSYRPAIVQRIATVRGEPAEDGSTVDQSRVVSTADGETAVQKTQEAASQHSQNTAYPPPAIPPAVTPPAVTPEAVTPEAIVPEAVVPGAVTPEAITPEAVVPEAVIPQALTPQAAPQQADPQEAEPESQPETEPEAISPTGESAPGSPVPANNQP
jgi:hypothetical protein